MISKAWTHFNQYERECSILIEGYQFAKNKKADELVRLGLRGLVDCAGNAIAAERYPLLAAYDLCLRCSHLFNILDARGAISVTERVGVIARVRALAVGIAKAWVDQQKSESAPPEKSDEPEPARHKASRLKDSAELVGKDG